MERADKGLGYLLNFEHVAWYENGEVTILDRRIYPTRIEFVTCHTHNEVAQAIADMVTQSAGPYVAARMGMALAAYECRNMGKEDQIKFLESASYTLSHARPTTAARMENITRKCLEIALSALEKGERVDEAVFEHALAAVNDNYLRFEGIGETLVSLFPQDKCTVLTQCFGETIIGMMIRAAQKRDMDFKMVCMETRPYFQGARLTASVAEEMGVDVTVITDNMAAYAFEKGMVDVFTSAADVITMQGHVINKIGTYQLALLCKHFGINYYATGMPNRKHNDASSVKIEMRDPNLVLEAMGVRLTREGVKGWYPAFDITPPDLVSAIVTDKGAYKASEVHKYYEE